MRFFRWIYEAFNAPCNEGFTEMLYDATPEEAAALNKYWKEHPLRPGQFY